MIRWRWFIAAAGVALLAALSIDAQDNGSRFSTPGKYGGKDLDSAQTATVSRAIDSIATPPPASLHYWDANGDSHTVSCSTIAADLRGQLGRGAIDAETLNTRIWGVTKMDGCSTTAGDQMNVDSSLLGEAGRDSSALVHLEEVLVHEWEHKAQDSTESRAEGEINALSKELVYKIGAGLDTTDALMKETLKDYLNRRVNYAMNAYVRRLTALLATIRYVSYLNLDTTGSGTDSYAILQIGGGTVSSVPLGALRAYDLLVYQRPPWLPPDYSLALVCGAIPGLGVAQLQAFQVFNGTVTLTLPPVQFGPPLQVPMSFESMDWVGGEGHWGAPMIMLDGLNHQIHILTDTDGDMLPDAVQGTFAGAMQPGFEMLLDAHGVDWLTNPLRGGGVALSIHQPHLGHDWVPNETIWFLPDVDGNLMADACLPVPMYEFMQFKPCIMPPALWPGDMSVNLHATWMHMIHVYSTDPTGTLDVRHDWNGGHDAGS